RSGPAGVPRSASSAGSVTRRTVEAASTVSAVCGGRPARKAVLSSPRILGGGPGARSSSGWARRAAAASSSARGVPPREPIYAAGGRGGALDAPARGPARREPEELAETVAWQLLLRWGVVSRDVNLEEQLAVPWGTSCGRFAASRPGA